ncbi:CDP-alcohol phosphatidyltransferase family protein, partial [Qaidamihabitans albus]|uniref:CDP-alcohol phosphatidyltransferase family protein n=1 Tax=Qaidamihabitans albus TaxID=2795733 RepID=UPI0018F15FDD
MLEQHRSLGWANVVTLTRANLPGLTGTRWSPVLVLGGDLADGRLARRLGTRSPFGAAADSLADAAFWIRFAHRHEQSRWVRAAALLAWALPVATVSSASVGRGRMVDAPRPALLRPAAAMQAILTVRAIRRAAGPSAPPGSRSRPRVEGAHCGHSSAQGRRRRSRSTVPR